GVEAGGPGVRATGRGEDERERVTGHPPAAAARHLELRQPVESEGRRIPATVGEDLGEVRDGHEQTVATYARHSERGADVVAVDHGVVPERFDGEPEC